MPNKSVKKKRVKARSVEVEIPSDCDPVRVLYRSAFDKDFLLECSFKEGVAFFYFDGFSETPMYIETYAATAPLPSLKALRKSDMKEEIRITPEGETRTLVFQKGFSSCGSAKKGIPFCITKPFDGERQAGGVITNDDARRLMLAIQEHLNVTEPTPEPTKPKCKCSNLQNGDLIHVDENGMCRGCGRGVQRVPEPAKTVEEILKEFDKNFTQSGYTPSTPDGPEEYHYDWSDGPSEARAWLERTLTSHRSSIIEEVVKMAEGMKRENVPNLPPKDMTTLQRDNYFFNLGVDTPIRKLRE